MSESESALSNEETQHATIDAGPPMRAVKDRHARSGAALGSGGPCPETPNRAGPRGTHAQLTARGVGEL